MTIGLSSSYRSLEAQAQRRRYPSLAPTENMLAILFVCTTALPEPACNSLPLLLASASSTTAGAEPIRLVPVTDQSAAAIASALDLPRASMLGVSESAPGAKPLMQFVRETFPPVDVPWLRSGPLPAQYLPLKVETARLSVGKRDKPIKQQLKSVK